MKELTNIFRTALLESLKYGDKWNSDVSVPNSELEKAKSNIENSVFSNKKNPRFESHSLHSKKYGDKEFHHVVHTITFDGEKSKMSTTYHHELGKPDEIKSGLPKRFGGESNKSVINITHNKE